MKHMEDLARKVSKFHEEGKGIAKPAPSPADPEAEIPSAEHTKTPDEMHSELSSMICPDCHKNVKAMMVKHGMMKNPAADDAESHAAAPMSKALK